MKHKNKIIVLFVLILAILFGFVYFTYIYRGDTGIKYKTYVSIDENGEESKIKIDKDNITFIDFDFQELYNVMATIELAKNNGVNLNTLTQVEKDEQLKSIVDEMIYNNVLTKKTPYSYTYDVSTNTITVNVKDYTFSLTYKDESFINILPMLKRPSLDLYNTIYK